MNKILIVDTCSLMDYLLPHRPEHKNALAAFTKAKDMGFVLSMPAHGFCEMKSAVLCEAKNIPTPMATAKVKKPDIQILDVDESFVLEQYLPVLEAHGIIDLKGGDMIYVVKAISMGCSILTQDKKMKTIANNLVLNTAMNYEDFLNANT